MLDPYEVYTCYCALKAHFNSSYDYHKYKGKIKNIKSKQDFERSNYKFLFTKYCKFTKNTLESIFVSNFLKNKNFWAGDYEIAINNQKSHLSTTDSLSYVFLNELNFLNSDLSKNISVETGSHPYLLKLYLSKKISLETLNKVYETKQTFLFTKKRPRCRQPWFFLCYIGCNKYTNILERNLAERNSRTSTSN